MVKDQRINKSIGILTHQSINFPLTHAFSYRDVECVYKWCVDNKIVNNPKEELVLYGQSIGSGPTCYIASQPAKFPIAGIVLHSPLLSGTRVLTPSRILCLCDIFPNIDRINKVRCPVFIIHGVEDNEVHFFHGEKLFFKVPNEYKSDPWYLLTHSFTHSLTYSLPLLGGYQNVAIMIFCKVTKKNFLKE